MTLFLRNKYIQVADHPESISPDKLWGFSNIERVNLKQKLNKTHFFSWEPAYSTEQSKKKNTNKPPTK